MKVNMKEKLTLADLGRVFETLCARTRAGDVPEEIYEDALERVAIDHIGTVAPAIRVPEKDATEE